MDCGSGPGIFHSAFAQTGPFFHAAVINYARAFLAASSSYFVLMSSFALCAALSSVVMSLGLRSFFTEGCASTAGFNGLHLFRDGIGVEFHCGVLS